MTLFTMETKMIKHLQTGAVPESAAPFSQVVTDGRYAHLAGLVAADFPEGQAVLGDPGRETGAILRIVNQMLGELGIGMDRIVRTDVHLADLGDFDAMDETYRCYFSEGRFPARTTTESPHLFGGSKVEITCTALLMD